MEKKNGAPEGFEYSEEVTALVSEIFSVSDVDVESTAKFNEEMVEKLMQELLGEMNDFRSATESNGSATANDGGTEQEEEAK